MLNKAALAAEPRWEAASTILQGSSVPLVVKVEVVSTNWRDDYEHKRADYEAMGIAEYWIVDSLGLGGRRYVGEPKQPTITVCEWVGEYQMQRFLRGDRLSIPMLNRPQSSADRRFPCSRHRMERFFPLT